MERSVWVGMWSKLGAEKYTGVPSCLGLRITSRGHVLFLVEPNVKPPISSAQNCHTY